MERAVEVVVVAGVCGVVEKEVECPNGGKTDRGDGAKKPWLADSKEAPTAAKRSRR